MNRRVGRTASLIAILMMMFVPGLAAAQELIRSPSGKGRLAVVLSGATGSGNYREIATRIAGLGYDVVLFDSNKIIASAQNKNYGAALRAAVAQARQIAGMPTGKIAMVGFSLGGGLALGLGSTFSDEVAVVSAWYPMTSEIKNVPGFVGRISVPVVMFAATNDDYKFCCLITKADEIAGAAKAANAPFELTRYAGAKHGFSVPNADFDRAATDDALARTATALRRYLPN
jgi:dienelactone hydrolase